MVEISRLMEKIKCLILFEMKKQGFLEYKNDIIEE